MKNSVVFGFVALLIFQTACTPQDPAVLSRDEKAAEQARREGGGRRAQVGGKARFPVLNPKEVAGFSDWLLDRQAQSLSWLALVLEPAATRVLPTCLRLTERRPDAGVIDARGCVVQRGASRLEQKGRLNYEISRDGTGNVQFVSIASDESSPALAWVTRLSKNQHPSRAEIRETVRYEWRRLDGERFEMITAVSTAQIEITGPQKQTGEIESQAWGTVGRETSGEWTSEMGASLRHEGEIEGGSPGSPLEIEIKPRGLSAELIGTCGSRRGQWEVIFNFIPAKNRNGDLLTLANGQSRLEGSKPLEWIPACASQTGQPLLPNWGDLFLF